MVVCVAVATVVVVAVGASMVWRRISESYWLGVLSTGSEAEKLQAVEKLGDVGTERSLWRVCEEYFRRCPPPLPLHVADIPGYSSERPVDLATQGFQKAGGFESFAQWNGPATRAVAKIRDRIGWQRALDSGVAILGNAALDLRTRLYATQTIVMAATAPDDRPEAFRTNMAGGTEGPEDGAEKIAIARSSKPKAIAVLVEAL